MQSSIYELFRDVVAGHASESGYRYKTGGTWTDVSWSEADRRVRGIARSLMALGVERGDRVAILSQTRLEWILCDLAIMACGGVAVGVYPASVAADCAYIVDHCDAAVLVVENQEQLEKIASVRAKLPKVKHIVRFDGPGEGGAIGWQQFLEVGAQVPEEELTERAAGVTPDDLAMLVYTSGTTGVPKGVMISHKNLLFTVDQARQCTYTEPHFVTFLFLPLAHVFARIIVFSSMSVAITVVIAESIQKVAENLREAQPHYFASVPRIYEKVHEKILGGVEAAGGVKAALFHWALGVGREVSQLQQARQPIPFGLGLKHRLAHRLVFHKIHAAFGGRLVWAVSGAAPLNRQIAEFFHACGILVLEGLGMTENTSFSHVNRYQHNKFGTVGQPGPDIECTIAPDGEILVRGDNVMRGYFKNPEATAETIDEDGWLHTGDIGEIDSEGFLRITDRKKDLIITAGGKNIAPQHVEQVLRTSRYISQAVAIGDQRKYLVALIALDPDNLKGWAQNQGLVGSPEELASRPEVQQLIAGEIEERNRELASYESIKKFRILPRDLTVEDGDLTASLKVRRKVVIAKHQALIDEMYAENGG